MLHVGWVFSMRGTVVRAKQAQLAELSTVGLFKRLRKTVIEELVRASKQYRQSQDHQSVHALNKALERLEEQLTPDDCLRLRFVANQKLCDISLKGCAFFPDASIDQQLRMIALPVGDRSVGNERAGCNFRILDNVAFPRALGIHWSAGRTSRICWRNSLASDGSLVMNSRATQPSRRSLDNKHQRPSLGRFGKSTIGGNGRMTAELLPVLLGRLLPVLPKNRHGSDTQVNAP